MAPKKMTKSMQKQAIAAEESFHSYYASESRWGSERWQNSLYPALAKPTRYVAMVNRFAPIEKVKKVLQESQSSLADLQESSFPHPIADSPHSSSKSILCYEHALDSLGTDGRSPQPFPAPSITARANGGEVLTHWNLDAASALAAHMLDVQGGHRVLDLCAAPGGKSLALAQTIWPELHAEVLMDSEEPPRSEGCLHSNELELTRNKRLASNLKSYLPTILFERGQVKILRLDAGDPKCVFSLPLKPGEYDRILLDAPCSSERHIIHAQIKAASSNWFSDEMSTWRPGASKNLAKVQTALLMTALKAVKIGGKVVYATCSIDNNENDGVVEKVIATLEKEKKKGLNWGISVLTGSRSAEPRNSDLKSWIQETEYGGICLPDHPAGGQWGPLFFAVLTKILLQESG